MHIHEYLASSRVLALEPPRQVVQNTADVEPLGASTLVSEIHVTDTANSARSLKVGALCHGNAPGSGGGLTG